MKYCPKCNALLNKEAEFCSECGTKIESENKTSEPAQTPITPKQKRKKSSNRLLWVIIIIFTLVIIGALIAAFFVFRESDEKNSNSAIPSNQNLNMNVNENTNANVNLNQNVNSDENMNINDNGNININLNENSNENTNANLNENTNQEQFTQTDPVNPLRPPIPETIVTASSTLEDASNTGFDYSPSQVLDQDFSTAWTEGVNGYGVGEWIKMEFPGTAEINTIGIVPGYARDEEIYNENDRVADLELEFSGGSKITRTLADQYGMQFIEFPTVGTTYIKLTIKGVYDGSKYQDAAIAELDIWSDYVTNKDAQAALEYYQTNKESAALKPPVKYIEKTYMAIGIMGSPTPEIPVNFYSPTVEPMVAAAEIPAATPQGITFTAKWFNEGNLFHTQDITSYSPVAEIATITIVSTAQISDLVSPPDVLWPLGDYDVRWYEDGQLSTTQIFAVTPQ
ncbi:MAG: hypothetical protein COT24_03870 [Candidatus Kerfeldbacteria bacterium CG08_land_8_20_14_0_20_40_16]|uniref:F5/8 type C domain-containing protein n=2 Tax=Bacteria candidate phyla TaxID=1783234 RepID=A0A2G9XBF0_UNCKA|nr:MAG: hypothetical protein COX53_03290 [candidate division WWE3 bacterium CG23_combo_of_CG06-09_8_20_14_all_40_14]PIS42332.1 MAG: hypothetical protein COT24_03870 [Candidatus Kerfeldbacteria bacterium CG08_land_8_20_14_0_20_40_16]